MSALPAWKELEAHGRKMRTVHLRRLFAEDPGRGERFAAEAAGLYLDYSKNRIDGETLRLLMRLAEERGLRRRIGEPNQHNRQDGEHRSTLLLA